MVYNYIMKNFNLYNDLVKTQPFISNQDFRPRIAKNVLLPEHIEEIYEAINKNPDSNTRVQPWAGHRLSDIHFSSSVEERITQVARETVGEDIDLKYDYSFARYSPKFGYECKLFPHYDTRETQRITFDIQLRASEPWALYVEGEEFVLNDNEALAFAGTQQIHWRENKKIARDAEIDMIFCHLNFVKEKPLDENQTDILEKRAIFLMDHTGLTDEHIKL